LTKLDICSLFDALELSLSHAPLQTKREVVMIDDALDRILASDVVCQKSLPSFDNSAMDGFAFRHEDVGRRVTVVSTIFAGDKPEAQLTPQSCYKIMTGAQVPHDADTIVPIENCLEVGDDFVLLPSDIKKGSSLRKRGEEQMRGSTLMSTGERITPAHIAMLSAQGIMALEVYAPLSIAVVSTGDEIREPWQSSSDDEIYNANAFGISALLKKSGFAPTYVGKIPDDLSKSISFISDLKSYDVIITTGGISMGDADFLDEAFASNGLKSLFHGVNVKPGRPTMMGVMGSTFVMAMPGNPLTALVNLYILSLPILSKMQGAVRYHHSFVYAQNSKQFRANPKKANMVLGSMANGEFTVTRDNRYGSGMLTPILESNSIVLLDAGVTGADEGEMLKVILLDVIPDAMSAESLNLA